MEFKLRNDLLVLLQDNATAFATAAKFVDSEDKLEVFRRQYTKHYQPVHGGALEQSSAIERASATATEVSTTLWEQCYTDLS